MKSCRQSLRNHAARQGKRRAMPEAVKKTAFCRVVVRLELPGIVPQSFRGAAERRITGGLHPHPLPAAGC